MPLPEETSSRVPTGASDSGAETCVICLGSLRFEPAQADTSINARPCAGYMQTPCAHQFHQACLSKWMQMKLECPTCRAELPPIRVEEESSSSSEDEVRMPAAYIVRNIADLEHR